MEHTLHNQLTNDSAQAALPRHVKRALDHMRGNISERITLPGLASACASSERTLQKQFRVFVGLSPLAYLHRLRLNLARGELLKPDNEAAVADIAGQYGLIHLGRFAVEYHRAFGETPSSTRQRVRALQANSTAARPAASRACDDSGSSPIPVVWRQKPSLMILPLRTETLRESRDARDLTERLAATLSGMRAATVSLVHPSRAQMMVPRRPSTQNAGSEYYLLGRLTQHDERARVIVGLVDAATDRHIWGDSFDGYANDPFGLQDRVVDGVQCGVAANIMRTEIDRARSKDPRDQHARDLTTRALPLLLGANLPDLRKAMGMLNRAIAMDPADALAVALLGSCHLRLCIYHGTLAPEVERDVALGLAERARVLDDDDPLVVSALASTAFNSKPDSDHTNALVARALAMDPTSGWAWDRRGHLRLMQGGEPDRAIADLKRALQLWGPSMPRNTCLQGIGWAHVLAGRFDEAMRCSNEALAVNPEASWMYLTRSCFAFKKGDFPGANAAVESFRRAHPDTSISLVVKQAGSRDPDWLDALHRAGMPL